MAGEIYYNSDGVIYDGVKEVIYTPPWYINNSCTMFVMKFDDENDSGPSGITFTNTDVIFTGNTAYFNGSSSYLYYNGAEMSPFKTPKEFSFSFWSKRPTKSPFTYGDQRVFEIMSNDFGSNSVGFWFGEGNDYYYDQTILDNGTDVIDKRYYSMPTDWKFYAFSASGSTLYAYSGLSYDTLTPYTTSLVGWNGISSTIQHVQFGTTTIGGGGSFYEGYLSSLICEKCVWSEEYVQSIAKLGRWDAYKNKYLW